ncbi:MAG: transposase [Candidatus Zixiibacteriota bacterium]
MSKLKRYYNHGNQYFVTAVTHNRQHILVNNIDLLCESIKGTKAEMKFIIIAYVIMPDHFHAIIEINKSDLSRIMQKIKLSFSKKIRTRRGCMDGRIWQRRFWDHVIRDQNDLNKHIDYIHFNPVKHGLAGSPFEWEYSSIHDFYADGFYSIDWKSHNIIDENGEYGE